MEHKKLDTAGWEEMTPEQRFRSKAEQSGVWRVLVGEVDGQMLFRTNEPGDPLPDGLHSYGFPKDGLTE